VATDTCKGEGAHKAEREIAQLVHTEARRKWRAVGDPLEGLIQRRHAFDTLSKAGGIFRYLVKCGWLVAWVMFMYALDTLSKAGGIFRYLVKCGWLVAWVMFM
jgi:hypothetical protein